MMHYNLLLLIDDDQTLLELLADHLIKAGYRVVTAANGSAGLQAFNQYHPDLIILDVMMPKMDGWTVCERVRGTADVPIIMLTAKGEEIDKLRGFHLGVDDYVNKPFSFGELAARVGAVLARARHTTTSTHYITSSDLTIDLEQRRVTVAGRVVDLTPTEYRLLEMLAIRANRTIPTEILLDEVWGHQYVGESEHVKHVIWTSAILNMAQKA